MKRNHILLISTFAVLACLATGVSGQLDTNRTKPAPGNGFLSVGGRYRIIFPETFPLFSVRADEVTRSTTQQDGKVISSRPVVWKIAIKCEHFVVTRVGPRGWVQIEHPSDSKDFGRWTTKLRAIQAVQQKIANLDRAVTQKQAAEVVKTKKTWVNIDRAIAIQDVATEVPTSTVSFKATTDP